MRPFCFGARLPGFGTPFPPLRRNPFPASPGSVRPCHASVRHPIPSVRQASV
jgi:hypothetical protein